MPDMHLAAHSLRGGIVLATATLLLAGIDSAYADAPPLADPLDHMELDFDSGTLYSVGSRASPLVYNFLPQIFTLKQPVQV
jgi:hypothetical protein